MVIERSNQNIIGQICVNPYQEEREENFDILSKIIAAITLSGTCSPDFAFSCDLCRHPTIPPGSLGGLVMRRCLQKILLKSQNLRSVLCFRLEGYLQIAKGHWAPFQLSIARLGRSRSHNIATDTAIDLGISLESCLNHNEKGDGAKGELRNKIDSRGAWLLRRDKDERLENSKTLKLAYDHRSAAVHSGQLNKFISEKLEEVDAICSRILRMLLKKRKFLDWERMLIGFDEEAWP